MNLPIHLRLRPVRGEDTTRTALRAVLNAAHLLGLAAGTHLRKLRALPDPVAELQARRQEAEIKAAALGALLEILLERFAKVPERHRPHCGPAARFRLLELKSLLGWNRLRAARMFLVCPNTLSNWERSADSTAMTVGSTVKPVPPVRRFADVVRHLVQVMLRYAMRGEDRIAAILARAGWKISARSIRRIGREKPVGPPLQPPQKRGGKPVIARFLHHTWMMDVTIVKALFGLLEFHVAGVFDAFSRVPLALQVLDHKPRASEMARLFRKATRPFGVPKYLITDLGKECTARLFRKVVARSGARQRFASKDNLYATARLERFWRSLKDDGYLRLDSPATREDLERSLGSS
jgi:transposase InsO family protein